MTSEVNKLFGCPVCGCRIGPGESACPRCGHKFSSHTKFECPFCGELVDQGLASCPVCSVNFTDFSANVKKTAKADGVDKILEDLVRLGADASTPKESALACPNCGMALTGTEDACPECHVQLSTEVSAICPACGAVVPEDATACPDCGASFLQEEGAAEDEKSAHTAEEVDSALEAIERALMRKSAPEPAPKPVEQAAPPKPKQKPKPAEEQVHIPLVFTKKIITIQPPPPAADEDSEEEGAGPRRTATGASEAPKRKVRKVKPRHKAK